jgi:hypothetical protein
MNKEDVLQAKIIVFFKNEYQINGKGLIFAVPNGGSRNIIEAKKLKATGLMAGVSDLIVLKPNGETFFIEIKTDVGIQSPVQINFQKKVEQLGFKYFLVRSLEDFKELILC